MQGLSAYRKIMCSRQNTSVIESDTIVALKAMIKEQLDIFPDKQHLVYNRQTGTLADYEIRNRCKPMFGSSSVPVIMNNAAPLNFVTGKCAPASSSVTQSSRNITTPPPYRFSSALVAFLHPLVSYPIAFLSLIGQGLGADQNPPLGYATRIGMPDSQFNVEAHRLSKAIIEYSPSPSTEAREFLIELKKCEIAAVMALGNVHSFFRFVTLVLTLRRVDTIGANCSTSPDDWPDIVHFEITTNNGDISLLTQLACHYFSHLSMQVESACSFNKENRDSQLLNFKSEILVEKRPHKIPYILLPVACR